MLGTLDLLLVLILFLVSFKLVVQRHATDAEMQLKQLDIPSTTRGRGIVDQLQIITVPIVQDVEVSDQGERSLVSPPRSVHYAIEPLRTGDIDRQSLTVDMS